LSPVDLDRRVPYRNSRGAAFDSRVEDILLHVAMHGSYHRSQVALVVRTAGFAGTSEPTPRPSSCDAGGPSHVKTLALCYSVVRC